MSKVTLTNLDSIQNDTSAVSKINNNTNTITTAFDNFLSRDGTAPNEMLADLDMNSKRILNLPDPTSNAEPITKGYALAHYTSADVDEAITKANEAAASAATASAAAAEASTAATSANGTVPVADITALQALDPTYKQAAIITGSGESIFTWVSGDQSAQITRDPHQAFWVPPSTDTTGASGAWRKLIREVTIEQFGGGVDVADNTAALLAAIASSNSAVTVKFPQNGDYTFTQANAIDITKGGVYLEGNGRSTALKYVPDDDGIFLKWTAPIAFGPIFGGGIRKLSIYSTDTTTQKTAVHESAVSGFEMVDVSIGYSYNHENTYWSWTGGTTDNPSVCFYPNGWDLGNINTVWFSGDMPVVIGMNPYWSYAQDHWHWSNCYFQGQTSVSTYSNVHVQPGVAFSNTIFDGVQAWVNGLNGFFYEDNAAINAVESIDTAGSGYAVGDIITLAGGTLTTKPKIIVLTVNDSGGVTKASVNYPGADCTAYPTGDIWTQDSTTGSGTGMKVKAYYVSGFNLKFENVRIEQGDQDYDDSAWSFYIQQGGIAGAYNRLSGVIINNAHFDGYRNGVYLENTQKVKISNCVFTGNSTYAVTTYNITSANNNDDIILENNSWLYRSTGALGSVTTGMNLIYSSPNSTSTNATALQNAKYSSSQTYEIPVLSSYSSTLTGDTAISTSAYTDGPSVSQGTSGTWYVTAKTILTNTSGADSIYVRLTDGTTIIDSGYVYTTGSGDRVAVTLSGIINSPAGNIKLACKAGASNSYMVYSSSGDAKDTSITAIRIG